MISELPARWSRLIARFLESGHDLRAVPGISGISVFAAYGVPERSQWTNSTPPAAGEQGKVRKAGAGAVQAGGGVDDFLGRSRFRSSEEGLLTAVTLAVEGRSSARPWTHRMFMTASSAARQLSASMPAPGSRPTACSNK